MGLPKNGSRPMRLRAVSREKSRKTPTSMHRPFTATKTKSACSIFFGSLRVLIRWWCETEILGQAKKAYEAARSSGTAGPYLDRLFQRAFRVPKQVRTHTDITRG